MKERKERKKAEERNGFVHLEKNAAGVLHTLHAYVRYKIEKVIIDHHSRFLASDEDGTVSLNCDSAIAATLLSC